MHATAPMPNGRSRGGSYTGPRPMSQASPAKSQTLVFLGSRPDVTAWLIGPGAGVRFWLVPTGGLKHFLDLMGRQVRLAAADDLRAYALIDLARRLDFVDLLEAAVLGDLR